MDRAVEQPLRIHLALPAQHEAAHSLVVPYVSEYGFHYMHPSSVDLPGLGQVDLAHLAHHLLLERVFDFANFYMQASHLASCSLETSLGQRTSRAVASATGVSSVYVIAVPASPSEELEELSVRADVPVVFLVVFKILALELDPRFGLVAFASLECRISPTKPSVGNAGVHSMFLGGGQIVLAVILAVGRQVGCAQRAFAQLALLQVSGRFVQSSRS